MHKINIENIVSPFGGKTKLIEKIPTSLIDRMYIKKINLSTKYFFDNRYVDIYFMECELTGYKFYYPYDLEGSEEFYNQLSSRWKNYYRKWRWEYSYAKQLVNKHMDILEIGCGRGFFLKEIESKVNSSLGLELNKNAINSKVCKTKIINQDISQHLGKYDMIFSFQVLEHISNPKVFLEAALKLLRPNGLLAISTPNFDYGPHFRMEDAFDLPPHHVGSYTIETHKKIAKTINSSICIAEQSVSDWFNVPYSKTTTENTIYKLFVRFTNKLGSRILKLTKEPGHTIFVVYQK